MCNSCILIHKLVSMSEREVRKAGRGFGKESWIAKMERRVEEANWRRAPAGLPLLYIFRLERVGRVYYGVTMEGYGSVELAESFKDQVCGVIVVVNHWGEPVPNEFCKRLELFRDEQEEDWEPLIVGPGFQPEYLQHLPPPPPIVWPQPALPPPLEEDEGISMIVPPLPNLPPIPEEDEEESESEDEWEVQQPVEPPRPFDWSKNLEDELERVAAEQQQQV